MSQPPFQSVIVPLDLTPASDRVVERVSLLPLAEDAEVTLLHVVPGSLGREARARAQADARKALAAAGKHLTRRCPGLTVEPIVTAGSAADEIAAHARAVEAELIVMGRGASRGLAELFLGSTAERVIRQARFPVLVARQLARAWARPLLAIEVDDASAEVVRLALRLLPAPRPPLSVVHAYDTPYSGMVYPSLSREHAQEYRAHHRAQALESLTRALAKTPGAAEVTWTPLARFGSPRAVIPKTVARLRADLLVLGTHGHAGLAHALLGTVAGDVLREVSCDVLIVPPHHERAKRKGGAS
jgi:nucleotide-binding universal stress UspA family protein